MSFGASVAVVWGPEQSSQIEGSEVSFIWRILQNTSSGKTLIVMTSGCTEKNLNFVASIFNKLFDAPERNHFFELHGNHPLDFTTLVWTVERMFGEGPLVDSVRAKVVSIKQSIQEKEADIKRLKEEQTRLERFILAVSPSVSVASLFATLPPPGF